VQLSIDVPVCAAVPINPEDPSSPQVIKYGQLNLCGTKLIWRTRAACTCESCDAGTYPGMGGYGGSTTMDPVTNRRKRRAARWGKK